MKKLLYIIPLLFGMTLTSCYDEDIENINSRLDAIENTQIATISQQITSINNSILLLNNTDKELKDYITTLEKEAEELEAKLNETNTKIDSVKSELTETISTEKANILAELEAFRATVNGELDAIKAVLETLKAKDAELEKQIAELKDYVDTELKATKDWATATFATLEQYNTVASTIATIEGSIEELNTSIATVKEEITAAYTAALEEAISALETSMKEWVNEQLTGYYTIAQMDAKLEALQNSLTEGDGALQKEIDTLRKSLAAQKTELTEAYTTAITEAINANNGVIDAKIASAIGKVNEQIAGLEERINTLEERITKLEGTMSEVQEQVAALVARIQSISYIPRYSDGKASIDKTKKIGVFEFQISPKDAVAELEKVWQSALTMQAVHTQTRAVSFIEFPVTYFDADTENGTFLIEVDAANLGDQFFSGDIEASASLHISDGNNDRTSEYINLVVGEVESLTNNTPPANEIWYTNGSTTDPSTPNKTDVFGATYVSNTYDAKKGCWVILFDGDVTEIGIQAFRGCSSLTSVTIPDGVTEIGYHAFYNCTSLTSITIPDSVTSIGNTAFRGCSSLTSFHGKFASDDNRCLIIDGVLNSFAPAGLTAYTIPDGVTKIRDYAFNGCSSLTSITIPDGVTEIGGSAFKGCFFTKDKFINNSSLNTEENNYWGAIMYDIMQDDGLCINGTTVVGCRPKATVTIPDSVTEIGERAFQYCTSLTSITIPDSVTSIGDDAFYKCSSLTSVIIGNGVTSIGNSAFYKCSSLTSITIPDSVTSIGNSAFYGCSSLTSISIPNGVTEIVSLAFDECSSLTSITIPDSVTSIGNSAFSGCSSLTSITIPDSVTEIGNEAFCGCSSLTSVYCKPTTPPTGYSYMFYNNASGRKIYVPTESVEEYKIVNGWKDYANDIEPYVFE